MKYKTDLIELIDKSTEIENSIDKLPFDDYKKRIDEVCLIF